MRLPHVNNILNIATLYIEQYFDDRSLDFNIRATPDTATAFSVFLFMSPTAQWMKTHMKYIVTSRTDLRVGTILVP